MYGLSTIVYTVLTDIILKFTSYLMVGSNNYNNFKVNNFNLTWAAAITINDVLLPLKYLDIIRSALIFFS